MNIRIEANEQENGCKVWLGDNAVSFATRQEADAYITQLKERLEAAPLASVTFAEQLQ